MGTVRTTAPRFPDENNSTNGTRKTYKGKKKGKTRAQSQALWLNANVLSNSNMHGATLTGTDTSGYDVASATATSSSSSASTNGDSSSMPTTTEEVIDGAIWKRVEPQLAAIKLTVERKWELQDRRRICDQKTMSELRAECMNVRRELQKVNEQSDTTLMRVEDGMAEIRQFAERVRLHYTKMKTRVKEIKQFGAFVIELKESAEKQLADVESTVQTLEKQVKELAGHRGIDEDDLVTQLMALQERYDNEIARTRDERDKAIETLTKKMNTTRDICIDQLNQMTRKMDATAGVRKQVEIMDEAYQRSMREYGRLVKDVEAMRRDLDDVARRLDEEYQAPVPVYSPQPPTMRDDSALLDRCKQQDRELRRISIEMVGRAMMESQLNSLRNELIERSNALRHELLGALSTDSHKHVQENTRLRGLVHDQQQEIRDLHIQNARLRDTIFDLQAEFREVRRSFNGSPRPPRWDTRSPPPHDNMPPSRRKRRRREGLNLPYGIPERPQQSHQPYQPEYGSNASYQSPMPPSMPPRPPGPPAPDSSTYGLPGYEDYTMPTPRLSMSYLQRAQRPQQTRPNAGDENQPEPASSSRFETVDDAPAVAETSQPTDRQSTTTTDHQSQSTNGQASSNVEDGAARARRPRQAHEVIVIEDEDDEECEAVETVPPYQAPPDPADNEDRTRMRVEVVHGDEDMEEFTTARQDILSKSEDIQLACALYCCFGGVSSLALDWHNRLCKLKSEDGVPLERAIKFQECYPVMRSFPIEFTQFLIQSISLDNGPRVASFLCGSGMSRAIDGESLASRDVEVEFAHVMHRIRSAWASALNLFLTKALQATDPMTLPFALNPVFTNDRENDIDPWRQYQSQRLLQLLAHKLKQDRIMTDLPPDVSPGSALLLLLFDVVDVASDLYPQQTARLRLNSFGRDVLVHLWDHLLSALPYLLFIDCSWLSEQGESSGKMPVLGLCHVLTSILAWNSIRSINGFEAAPASGAVDAYGETIQLLFDCLFVNQDPAPITQYLSIRDTKSSIELRNVDTKLAMLLQLDGLFELSRHVSRRASLNCCYENVDGRMKLRPTCPCRRRERI